jgi:predicted ATP-dependent serine protease
MPGEGKSTFCMKLTDEISKEYNLLYVMAEENLNSDTLLDKKQRTLTSERNRKVSFVNRLPISEEE